MAARVMAYLLRRHFLCDGKMARRQYGDKTKSLLNNLGIVEPFLNSRRVSAQEFIYR